MNKQFAPVVTRRQSAFPCRIARYFDCTQWGGGFVRVGMARGAVVLHGDTLLNLSTGEVYTDARFGAEQK